MVHFQLIPLLLLPVGLSVVFLLWALWQMEKDLHR
jgi:hypothetical protein